jgi:hypothetical protein
MRGTIVLVGTEITALWLNLERAEALYSLAPQILQMFFFSWR